MRTQNTPVKWSIDAAPLSRQRLNKVAPAIRLSFGIVFIVWSWISTVLLLSWALEPVMGGSVTRILPDRYLVSLLLAAGITVAELATSERYPKVYWSLVLLCDAPFTAIQTGIWMTIMINARTHIPALGYLIIGAASLIIGILVARFGELLLMGKPEKEV